MDRREALKKLAIGGATAAGVTAVMTSTAFANPGTANCAASGDVSVQVNTVGLTVELKVQPLPSFACPCPPNGAPTVVYSWTFGAASSSLSNIFSTFTTDDEVQNWTFSLTVKCLDRNNQLVCSRLSRSGSVTRLGATSTFTSTGIGTTSIAYDGSTPCV